MNHIELGQQGETLAVNHLTTKGYKILERNYRWKNAEIDIVCTKKNELIIVEVKTRHTAAFGEPYEAVSRAKQRQIIRVTNKYIENGNVNADVRFDVISIVLNNSSMRLQHIENAFYPLVGK